jgi:tripartite-type tricarboxylate transporter receptor subunit TctC
MASMSGIRLVHVPYKSSSLALTDMLAGQIQVVLGSMLPTLPHVKSGRIAALAVTTTERWPTTPNIPTAAETLPGYDVELWFGMWGPKGIPSALVERLNSAVNKALREPDVEQQLSAGGLRASGGPPQRFAERVQKDVGRWRKVVAEAGIKAD